MSTTCLGSYRCPRVHLAVGVLTALGPQRAVAPRCPELRVQTRRRLRILVPSYGLYSYGLYRYGLYSYGLYS